MSQIHANSLSYSLHHTHSLSLTHTYTSHTHTYIRFSFFLCIRHTYILSISLLQTSLSLSHIHTHLTHTHTHTYVSHFFCISDTHTYSLSLSYKPLSLSHTHTHTQIHALYFSLASLSFSLSPFLTLSLLLFLRNKLASCFFSSNEQLSKARCNGK
jgi:hypothetical protein